MDCTRLWFDNSAPGSVLSVTVNGVTPRFTGGTSLTTYTTGGALITGSATNSLNGTSTKVFFEGGQIVFREVDSLASSRQTSTFAAGGIATPPCARGLTGPVRVLASSPQLILP